MSAPAVTVIMATYNHARYVKEAIESVLVQKGVNFEFLIADDGSEDGTADIVASIRDRRVRFTSHRINRGACEVTNELIEKASGEYIALINSDDAWIGDDKLAYQLQTMRAAPELGACFGRARFVDEAGECIPKSALPFGTIFDQSNRTQGRWLRRFFDEGNCICHPTMMIRASCYQNAGLYNNRLRQLPDLDMWIRLVKQSAIFVSDQELIKFRIRPGKNTSSQTEENALRAMNEHYLIASTFFQGVGRALLLDGFGDVMKVKELATEEHVEIEKTLLFFRPNRQLGSAYRMVGLLRMWELLNSASHREILARDYSIDDRWFHAQMGMIDVLRPRTRSPFEQILASGRQRLRWFLGSGR